MKKEGRWVGGFVNSAGGRLLDWMNGGSRGGRGNGRTLKNKKKVGGGRGTFKALRLMMVVHGRVTGRERERRPCQLIGTFSLFPSSFSPLLGFLEVFVEKQDKERGGREGGGERKDQLLRRKKVSFFLVWRHPA